MKSVAKIVALDLRLYLIAISIYLCISIRFILVLLISIQLCLGIHQCITTIHQLQLHFRTASVKDNLIGEVVSKDNRILFMGVGLHRMILLYSSRPRAVFLQLSTPVFRGRPRIGLTPLILMSTQHHERLVYQLVNVFLEQNSLLFKNFDTK